MIYNTILNALNGSFISSKQRNFELVSGFYKENFDCSKDKLLEKRNLKKKELIRAFIAFFASLASALIIVALLFFVLSAMNMNAAASSINLAIDTGRGNETFGILEILLLFAILALAPSLLLMVTSFTRIIIVFSFLRNALGVQQTPPNMVIIGLSIFMTIFVMLPTFTEMNETAIEPYSNGEITTEVAFERIQDPLKKFMLKQTGVEELNMFLSLSGNENALTSIDTEELLDLSIFIIIPSFVTSELKRAFTIGFLLFIPFLLIDMLVASVLMSMGMVMLPPSMVSLPMKLMLFVVVDGWGLMIRTLIQSFAG